MQKTTVIFRIRICSRCRFQRNGWNRSEAVSRNFRKNAAARYEEQYGLPAYDASILTQTKHMADMFEQTADLCGNPKKTANWLMGEGLRLLKEKGMEAEDMDFTPKHLADLIQAVEGGKIIKANAKKVFAKILEDDVSHWHTWKKKDS